MKRMFVDLETTGLYYEDNAIVQIAYILEDNGEVIISNDIKIRPSDDCNISIEALSILSEGMGIPKANYNPLYVLEELFSGDFRVSIEEALTKIREDMLSVLGIDNYYKKKELKTLANRFCSIGHNIKFDTDFLHNHWKKYYERPQKNRYLKNKNKEHFPFYYGGMVNSACKIDTISMAADLVSVGKILPENLKLETLCSYFNIPIITHDAISDIIATRNLYYKLKDFTNDSST